MMNCECVTVAYYPNDFNDEHINVGFLLHDIDNGALKRCFIRKRQRLKEFDDRLTDQNIDTLFDVINSALNDTFPEDNQLSIFGDKESIAFKEGYFQEIGKMFLNSLRFVDFFRAKSDNIDKYFDDNASLALYFDQDKDKRPSTNKITTIMRERVNNALKEAGIDSKSSFIVGRDITYGETIRFDYRFRDVLVKIIDPLSGSLDQKINLAKQWAFNILNYFSSNESLTVVIVVPDIWNKDQDLMLLKRIIGSVNAKVLTISDFVSSLESFRA